MEIELKFSADRKTALEILPENYKVISMDAIYYDSLDNTLSKSHTAFRLRSENGNKVLTIKYRIPEERKNAVISGDEAVSCEGLYKRGEINIDLPENFVLNSKELVPTVRTKFERIEAEIEYDGITAVVSYDEGEISALEKTAPISELEIELKEGSEEKLREFAQKIAEEYELKPILKSKLARGRELL